MDVGDPSLEPTEHHEDFVCDAVGDGLLDRLNPVVAVEADLIRIQSTREATFDLRGFVALEAENGEIDGIVVRRIIINVMDLDGLGWLPAYATGAVSCEQDCRGGACGNRGSRLCHLNDPRSPNARDDAWGVGSDDASIACLVCDFSQGTRRRRQVLQSIT
jgi:hypothetical protein